MKEIVIISQPARINHELIALLTALFPECDISIAAPEVTIRLVKLRRANH